MSDQDSIPKDMYGHPIFPLGETGFGISVAFDSDDQPYFTFFHEDGNSEQSLFSVMYEADTERMQTCDHFESRIAEVFGLMKGGKG